MVVLQTVIVAHVKQCGRYLGEGRAPNAVYYKLFVLLRPPPWAGLKIRTSFVLESYTYVHSWAQNASKSRRLYHVMRPLILSCILLIM
jgi:hypothetical protein